VGVLSMSQSTPSGQLNTEGAGGALRIFVAATRAES
jgi:hypothetical protein